MTSSCPVHQPTFGERLRSWRLARGLSQEALGSLLDPMVRHSTVSCWEQGHRHPSRRFLRQIVTLTGIPAHLALGVAGQERSPS